MKQFKDEQGYALLVVLLMVVLFLGLSAVFMAGSMSNAKQETTVDTSNLAVASAEMGVKYYSTDFQREIAAIKSDIIEETQKRLIGIKTCFDAKKLNCDTQEEITAMEKQIDIDMKALYINKVSNKAVNLEESSKQVTPFTNEDAHYTISETSIIKLNLAGKDVDLTTTTDKVIRSLEVKLNLIGKSKEIEKSLTGKFLIEVPESFLSPTESLTIKTTTINEKSMTYEDIFPKDKPAMECIDVLKNYIPGTVVNVTECNLSSDYTASKFVADLEKNGLNPKQFTAFTENFKTDVCSSCSNPPFAGLNIVVKQKDAEDLFVKNANQFDHINLIVDGFIDLGNTNGLGDKKGNSTEMQTLIFKELEVGNVQGGGFSNANLVILGKDDMNKDSRMIFGKNLTIGENGRLCFDMERIDPEHVENLSSIAQFSNKNATGQIIYYTNPTTTKRFILKDGTKKLDPERTIPYVVHYDNYTNFLSSCGANVSGVISEISTIPTSYVEDPDFDLDVEY